MLSNRLKGKVAVVTGIGSGIGQGCALMFARHGAKVFGCEIDAVSAERAVAMARQEALPIHSMHPCDLSVSVRSTSMARPSISCSAATVELRPHKHSFTKRSRRTLHAPHAK